MCIPICPIPSIKADTISQITFPFQVTLLMRHFRDVEINSLTTEQLKVYLSESSKALKPSSLAHRVRSMKLLLRWSYEEGHISINPAAKIKEP